MRLPGIVVASGLGSMLLASPAAAQDDNPRLRWEHFYQQRAYPFTVVPPLALDRARFDLLARWPNPFAAAPAPSATPWQQIGPERIPSNITSSGRLTAIAIHPTVPTTLYVGGAQGGVWKSVDDGATWVPKTDNECSLAMGSIAIDPVDPEIVYAGTGEQHFSGDSYYGCGVLRSDDGGTSWVHLGASVFANPDIGRAKISRLLIDPNTAGSPSTTTVLVASDFGVYRSTNSGTTWTLVLDGTATDLVMDASNPLVWYAARWSDGISKSIDGGVTWTPANTGFPMVNVARVNLAGSPSDPQTLYASVQNSTSSQLLGIYRSANGAVSWTAANDNGGASCGSQCWYDMTLAVHPTDPNTVFFGGISLFRSVNGGTTFEDVRGPIHVDQHTLVFDTANPNVLYVGNDGGVYRTLNATLQQLPVWETLNTTLSITQFYPGISLHPTDPNAAMGGTQDNGTLGYSGSADWLKLFGADGGYTAIDFDSPDTVYMETQWSISSTLGYTTFGGPRRSDNGGVTWVRKVNGISTSDRALFIPPIEMDPNDPATLYFGTYRVYKTVDRADTWTAISPDLTNGRRVSTIAIAERHPDVLYVGSSDGKVHRTSDGGANWVDVTTGIPPRFVRDIAIDPVDADVAYAVVSGFRSGHVFRTADGGATWQDVSGNLPDVPVNAVLIEPGTRDNIYIGTDLGAFVSTDAGGTWSPFNDGLPLVAVFDLTINPTSGLMLAGTHGRGMFAATLNVALAMFVTPESRIDSVAVGSTIAIRDSAAISFVGPGGVSQPWTATHGAGTWLTVTTAAGTGDSVVVWTRDPTGLPLGTYVDTVTVTATGSGLIPLEIVDSLVVGDALAMALSTAGVVDTTVAGAEQATPGSVTVALTGVGAADVAWTATHGGGNWITVIWDQGTGSGEVAWSRDASQLTPGMWIDTITVSAPGAGVSDQLVVDTLVVAPGFSLDDAANELFFGGVLSPLQLAFLEALGNDDGTYNLGEVLAWVDWCNRTASGGCLPDEAPEGDGAAVDDAPKAADSTTTTGRTPVRRQ
jgi:hypothetical protein